jgi:hypothetical protein
VTVSGEGDTMTPEERAERVLAELDREGLSVASAADAPRIRAVVATAIRAAVADEQEASLSDVSDDALLNELGLRLFAARLRFRGRNEQPGQVRLDLTADEVEELGRLTWSADVGVRDEGWQSDRREVLGRKVRDAIAAVRGQQGGAGA